MMRVRIPTGPEGPVSSIGRAYTKSALKIFNIGVPKSGIALNIHQVLVEQILWRNAPSEDVSLLPSII